MATMEQVARLAGVSVTTVSHVLNGTRPASEATRRRVLAAVEQTGYRPNTIARALARARTQSLGLAISGLANPYFGDVIAAVEAEASRAGHTLLLGDTREDPAHELRIVHALLERRVDGLLLAPSPGAAEHVLPYLAAQAVPVVLLDRTPSEAFDQVASENEEPTAHLVEHLAALGHRRIAMIVGAPALTTTEERVRGYRLGMERAGVRADDALIAGGGSQRDVARAATHELLDRPDPPTALVSGNNFMTIGVMRALADRGLRVPEDIALVTFDDFEWADLFAPRLTAVAQPTGELGRRAVELLLSRMADPDLPPRTVRLPTTFVHRDSCGCHLE
ncbi:MAG TPA: LacI family DNA-binding transcriptional regulator [Solirubrobacteraceae bacterium]|nr:LacI family DNA-binding transcriptional regulator [Solirubrobacteraceae bacterium]